MIMTEATISFKGDLFCNMEGHFWDVERCQEEWGWIMPQVARETGLVVLLERGAFRCVVQLFNILDSEMKPR